MAVQSFDDTGRAGEIVGVELNGQKGRVIHPDLLVVVRRPIAV